MKKIAIACKRSPEGAGRFSPAFKSVYRYLKRKGKEIVLEKPAAEILHLRHYNEFVRGKTRVDLILVMGGDGTILSVLRQMQKFNVPIFGINVGTLGFLSEIQPKAIGKALDQIFAGDYTIDRRPMIHVEVLRGRSVVQKLHALNEAVISHGSLARLIKLKTTVDQRKLTTYHADGLIVATPTGSTAYSLSAGGPILYPSLGALILTPICPHSFTQKPIVIPDSKTIDIVIESQSRGISLTVDGQESVPLEYGDRVRIGRDGVAQFVRLPTESFFATLREKLDWGKETEK